MIVAGIAGILAAGYFLALPESQTRHEQMHKDVYYCPMHPTYTSDRPGTCPICNMDLIKRKPQAAESKSKDQRAPSRIAPPEGYVSVKLDDKQRQLMGVRTVTVKKEMVTKKVHAVGFVAHNTDLYKVQNEFIDAYRNYVTVYRDYRRFTIRQRDWQVHRELQNKLIQAEHELTMLGLNQAHIENLKDIKWWQTWEQPELVLFRESNNYWIFAQIFERDIGFVEVGQKAAIEIPAFHEKMNGVIRSIGGYIDPQTRTVRALIEITGYRGELTANMIAYVDILSDLDQNLVVPRDSVMDLGTRKIVFIDRGDGVFDPVDIKVRFEGDNYWSIDSGLKEGDKIAASGNFLMDSESRMKAHVMTDDHGAAHERN